MRRFFRRSPPQQRVTPEKAPGSPKASRLNKSEDFESHSIKQLKKLCTERGIDFSKFVEKGNFVEALRDDDNNRQHAGGLAKAIRRGTDVRASSDRLREAPRVLPIVVVIPQRLHKIPLLHELREINTSLRAELLELLDAMTLEVLALIESTGLGRAGRLLGRDALLRRRAAEEAAHGRELRRTRGCRRYVCAFTESSAAC